MSKFNYRVGSKVKFRSFSGELRTVKVDMREADVKNGRPGFVGMTTDDEGCWGYDDQIISVVKF